jgi:PAS domain S-box-containing protein
MMSRIAAAWTGPKELLSQSLVSLNKLLDLDLALIQDAYEFEHINRERQLERARGERKFRHLVENASCLIMILDLNRDVVYFNRYAEAATGFAADELNDNGRAIQLLGSKPADSEARLAEAESGAGVVAFETEVDLGRAPRRWISWTLTRIAGIDEGSSVLAVGHDITEQRNAAEKLLQANRLATIGEMYARLAHESRNALQRMRFCTEMLAELVEDLPDAAELLKRSENAQHELHTLFDEIRNFASPIALELTDCRLSTLWRESWNLLQRARDDRRAELVELPDEIDRTTMSLDRFRMVQAFRNLFENSLAACPDPVTVSVACREAEVEGSRWVEVSVEDNGPGFDAQTMERIFEPFFTTRTTGTGLGLAIVRRIIEAHGGAVYAENSASSGARIVLRLPWRQNAATAADAG